MLTPTARSPVFFCGIVLVLLTLLSGEASPTAQAPWVRGARSRLAKSSKYNSKRGIDASECVETPPLDVPAPTANVWSGLSDWEAASVTKYLFD